MDKHKEDCMDQSAIRRLYIKGYNDKGKQRFIEYGLTCTSCDEFAKTNLDPKFKSRIAKMEIGYLSEENIKFIEWWHGGTLTAEQILKRNRARAIIEKCRRQQRRLLGSGPVTPKEQGLRKRIINLETFYEKAGSRLNVDLGWDHELLRNFLLSRPTKDELEALLSVGWLMRPRLTLHKSRGEKFWTRARFWDYLIYCCERNDEEGKENCMKILKADIQTRKEFMDALLNPEPKPEKEKEVITVTSNNNKKRKKTL